MKTENLGKRASPARPDRLTREKTATAAGFKLCHLNEATSFAYGEEKTKAIWGQLVRPRLIHELEGSSTCSIKS